MSRKNKGGGTGTDEEIIPEHKVLHFLDNPGEFVITVIAIDQNEEEVELKLTAYQRQLIDKTAKRKKHSDDIS
ncbi:hypothetical protein ACQYRI_16380 [Salmonella enterica]